ncbi:alpha-N-arabinofuranosidase, partial [bacterium]|nr:alpha-N-arabinofuranosidase [bacterium]
YTLGKRSLPALSVSASRDASGKIHVSLANLDPVKGMPVACDLRGIEKIRKVKAEIMTAKTMNAHNDFGKPEEVKPAAFSDFKVEGRIVNVKMPSKSVIMLELE